MVKSPKITNKFAFYGGLAYFVAMLAFFLLKLFASLGFLNFPYADLILKIVIQIGFMFILPLFLFSVFTKSSLKKTFDYFSFRKVSFKTIGLSFLLGICVFVLVIFISSFWANFLGLFGFRAVSSGGGDYSGASFFIALVFSAILPGICEETTHRGLLLFSMKKNGAIRAVLLSGLLFGLMHLNILQFGYAFVVGIFFGAITMMTKSIFPAMVMHFTNNALSTVWSYSLNSDWMSNRILDGIINFFENSNMFVATLVEILILSIAIWCAYFLILKIFEESKKSAFYRFKEKFAKQIKDSKLEQEIDLSNNEQIFQIYQSTQLLKLQEELKKTNTSALDAVNLRGSKAFEFVLNGEFKKAQKPKPLDNLFIYLSIGLGVFGTLFFFIFSIL